MFLFVINCLVARPLSLRYSHCVFVIHILLIRPFPYLRSAHRIFKLHVIRSCASLLLLLFLIRVFSYNITPTQFRSSHLSVSTHFHVPCSHSVCAPYCLTMSVSRLLFSSYTHYDRNSELVMHACLSHPSVFDDYHTARFCNASQCIRYPYDGDNKTSHPSTRERQSNDTTGPVGSTTMSDRHGQGRQQ